MVALWETAPTMYNMVSSFSTVNDLFVQHKQTSG